MKQQGNTRNNKNTTRTNHQLRLNYEEYVNVEKENNTSITFIITTDTEHELV